MTSNSAPPGLSDASTRSKGALPTQSTMTSYISPSAVKSSLV